MRIAFCVAALCFSGWCAAYGQDSAPAGNPVAQWVANAQSEDAELATGLGGVRYVFIRTAISNPTIVFCGDSRFTITRQGEEIAKALSPAGNVLLFDYPGKGQSSGHGTAQEYHNAEDALINMLTIPRSDTPIIFWGGGAGVAVCAAMAAQTPVLSSLVFDTSQASGDDIGALGGGVDKDVPALLHKFRGTIILTADPAGSAKPLADDLKKAGLQFTVLHATKDDPAGRMNDQALRIVTTLAQQARGVSATASP